MKVQLQKRALRGEQDGAKRTPESRLQCREAKLRPTNDNGNGLEDMS